MKELMPSKKLNFFMWNKFRTDVEDQPRVTSMPAFTRCCKARLEKQFNTEINLLSHLHPTIVIKILGTLPRFLGSWMQFHLLSQLWWFLVLLFRICAYPIQMGWPRSSCELSVFELLTCSMKKKCICLVLADTLMSHYTMFCFFPAAFSWIPLINLSLLGSLELFFS
uniref:uncharacterized protein LOC105352200 isoform X2 n=1 Tax=Fragaria vesca subsp. vesca TaxID=101020 RepID=UPI0005C94534|nr:PREDICTED: uncharacterized protein LOC105352200 isoform X2 [Fragaria vesca subsp. vesca]